MPRPASPYVFGGGATKSAGLNQRSTVGLSSLPDPIRLGQLGAPLLTPVWSETLNGRPRRHRRDPRQLPAADEALQKGTGLGHPPAAGSEWQFVDVADDRAMAHVEPGRTVPGVHIRDRLPVADRAAATRRGAAVIE